ncbi:MAG: LysM peptidoglycan-binding domain-containing protein [Bacteroidales bacterium]|jgi:LysM repeat protein|nr:LysM peptidoglycan-binding domain-containing protein [Bacteroidales bacterium]
MKAKSMIHRFALAASIILMMAGCPTLALSQVKVTISDQIVSVKGEKMYVHNVKKGETIYSICKAYNITSDELQRHNPIISDGLKAGQLLYIPVSALNSAKKQESDVTVTEENPQNQEPQNYLTHKVKWYEDLDEIAEKYGVTPEEILAFNNIKKKRKVKTGMELKIPIKQKSEPYIAETDPSGKTDNPETDPEPVETDTTTTPEYTYDNYTMPVVDKTKTRTITLLLPLNSEGKANANYMDFYSGALMALEQIKRDGGNIHLNVIDYASDNLTSIAESGKIEESDMIIGPIRYDALKEFMPVANRLRIPVISPLDAAADSLLEESPYLFQAALSKKRQAEAMAEMIAEKYRTCQNPNVILVYNSESSMGPLGDMLKTALEERGIYVDNAGGIGALSYMRRDRENVVVILTTAESYAAEALRNLDIKMIPPEKVVLFANSRWKGFETLDMNLYFKYNLQLCMPYNVDLDRNEVKQFIRRYRSLYNREPSANAFSGFDIVYLFCRNSVLGMREYAENPFNATATEYMENNLLQHNMLQQKFKFVKYPGGGWFNTAATQVSFNPDYTITSR